MKKAILVLGVIIVFAFIPEQKKIEMEIPTAEAIQKIIVHSINVLDNGTYRNNYDSVKAAIQELSSVYSYLDNLKKAATDTTKKK